MKLLKFIFFLFLMLGCSKNSELQFCTGVDKTGKGVDCGTVFTIGDLTVLGKLKEPLSSGTYSMKVFNVNESKYKPYKEKFIKLADNTTNISVELDIYDEGEYSVNIVDKNDKPVASGVLRVVEDY